MAVTTFDTLKFVRRLEQAGMPSEQAEAQAEVLTEAFNVNLEALVTKDYMESRLEVRFAEQQTKIDKRFADQTAYIDTRFAEQNAYIDTRFVEQKAYIDTRFAEVNSNFKTLYWILAIVVSATVGPLLERLIGF